MSVNGRFYGAGATEMGGSFFDYYAQYVGSFGAIRQTAIPSDADNNSNTGNNDNGNTGNNDNGNTNPQELPKDSGLGGNQLSSRTIGDYQNVPAADIKGSGNKLALTVKGTEINSEELRALGNKLGVAAGNPVDNSAYQTNQSYQYFAVSDDKYAAQTFGYVYNKANDKGGSDKQAVAFSVGKLTPETDAVLKPASKDSLKYSGDAFIGDNVGYQPIVKGTSLFNVSFFDKKITGKLEFANRAKPGYGGEKTSYPEKIDFTDGDIKGNTFTATGKSSAWLSNKATAQGQFYGEGAAELGGTFQTGTYSSTVDGSFGARKEASNNPPPAAQLALGGNELSKRSPIGSYEKITDIKGEGNKLVLNINGKEIDASALRAAGSIDGSPVLDKNYADTRSYQHFAVSGEKYKSQAFGYVYNKANERGKGDKQAIPFSAGALTPETDAIFDSKDNLKYKGEAFIGRNTEGFIVKGTSEFNINFFNNQISGDLSFENTEKPGYGGEKTRYPEKITFEKGTISGNTFVAEGHAGSGIYPESATAQGQFYGEGAAEMGGIFQIDSFISYTDGSFGAIKQ
jgi:hypothetical protein